MLAGNESSTQNSRDSRFPGLLDGHPGLCIYTPRVCQILCLCLCELLAFFFTVVHFSLSFVCLHLLKYTAFGSEKKNKCKRLSMFLSPWLADSFVYLFIFASVPIPRSLLTVCYRSSSWYLNWSMSPVTCLRYPTWAISFK